MYGRSYYSQSNLLNRPIASETLNSAAERNATVPKHTRTSRSVDSCVKLSLLREMKRTAPASQSASERRVTWRECRRINEEHFLRRRDSLPSRCKAALSSLKLTLVSAFSRYHAHSSTRTPIYLQVWRIFGKRYSRKEKKNYMYCMCER